MPKRKQLLLVLAALLVVYVGSYLALSRRGYAEADRWQMDGFFYFTPEDTNAWQWKHFSCVVLFAPANAVDRLLGTGRPPGSCVLFGLSK